MAESSEISWTDNTHNEWIGCTRVSPGCANCYAETLMDTRYHRVRWGKGQPRVLTSEANRKKPHAWNRAAERARKLWAQCGAVGSPPPRPRVFSASLSDWLDDEVDPAWLAGLLGTVAATPELDWLLLSKRPHLWRERVVEAWKVLTDRGVGTAEKAHAWHTFDRWLDGEAPPNVWVGTTVEDQQRADERVPHLLAIPARVRFLSCEPLLGPVDLKLSRPAKSAGDVLRSAPAAIRLAVERRHFRDCDLCEACRGVWCEASISEIRALMAQAQPGIDQVIIGGESGHGARPMDLAWARALRDQCAEAGTACFVKQLGGARDKRHDIEGFPEDLRLREVPRA